MRGLLSATATGIFALCVPLAGAFAHATPVEYIPAASSVLESAPQMLRIRFSERLEPEASFLSVAHEGKPAKKLDAKRAPNDPFTLEAPLTDEGTGAYLVRWQALSADDGHFTKGTFAFFRGTGSRQEYTSTFTLKHRSGYGEGTLIALELLGGALVLACIALRRTGERRRLRLLMGIGILLLLCGLLGSATFQIVTMSRETGKPALEAANIAFSTASGKSVLLRIAAALGLLGAFFLGKNERKERQSLVIMSVLIAALLILRASLSHAAANSFLPGFSVAVNALHLAAKELWIAGCVIFTAAVLPAVMRRASALEIARAHLSFARLANVCLLIGGITGAYITWLHLKDFPNVRATHWGMNLITLSTFAALLLSCRLYHLFITVPAAKRLALRHDAEDAQTVSSAGVTLSFEALAGIAVLLFSGMLIITTPPLHGQPKLDASARSGDTEIRLSPYRYDPRSLLVSFEDEDDATPSVETVVATLSDGGGEPLAAPVRKIFDGGYLLDTSYFTHDGEWSVAITGQRTGAYDAVASFRVRHPEQTRDDGERFWGNFERWMSAIAVFILLFCLCIHLLLRRWLRALPAEDRTLEGMRPQTAGETAAAALFGTVLLTFMAYSSQNHAHGRFQKICEDDGNIWQESVPMRDGVITSEAAVLGCTVEKTGTHVGDVREYDALSGTSGTGRKIPGSGGE